MKSIHPLALETVIAEPESSDMHRWKRRRMLALLLVAIVAVGAFVLWPPRSQVTQENFDRIRNGMSEVEVYEILGEPPHASGYRPDGSHALAWFSSDNPSLWMAVSFDAAGSVQDTDVRPAKESPLEIRWHRFRSRLKRLAERH